MILLSLCHDGWLERYRFGDPRILNTVCRGDSAIAFLRSQTFGQRTLFLIHGFNSDQDAAIASYQKISDKMQAHGLLGENSRYTQLVGVLWPGSVPVGYWIAEHRANVAGTQLSEIFGKLECASISIETHSLGARVAMGLLAAKGSRSISNLILTAPAIDDDAINIDTEWGKAIASHVTRALVCFSTRDEVLSGAYRWWGSFLRDGFGGHKGLGCTGPSGQGKLPGGVTLCDGSAYVADHSGWRDADSFYQAWSTL